MRDFLTKKKQERAERGIAIKVASHTQLLQTDLQRDKPTADAGDIETENKGLEIAAKGDPVSDVTNLIGQNKLKGCAWANERQR